VLVFVVCSEAVSFLAVLSFWIWTFENEDYKAELDQQSWITKIYHKDSLFFDAVIHNGSIPLSEFLNQLENLILNHKENVKNSN